jgi:hypothetical protein
VSTQKNVVHNVTLECGHKMAFPIAKPEIADTVWCTRCGDYNTVSPTNFEWHLKCEDCRASRGYGDDRLLTEQKAARHHMSRPTHTVKVMYGAEVIAKYSGDCQEPLALSLYLDNSGQLIPF